MRRILPRDSNYEPNNPKPWYYPSFMHRPKHIAEYVLIRVAAGAVNLIPPSISMRLGSLFGTIGFRCWGRRRRETDRRVRQVLGDQVPEAEVRRIAEAAFRELVRHAIEVLRIPKMTMKWVQQNVTFDQADRMRLDAAIGRQRGVIVAVSHLGNWDIAGVGLQQLGYPMTFIMKSQANPLLDRYLNRMREHLGSEVIERDDPMLLRKVIRSLRQGKVVAILVDLRGRLPDLELEFLGHTADLMRGLGLIAHLADCPVIPAMVTRLPDGRHHWGCADLVLPDPKADRNEDARRILQETLAPIEAAILEHPDQYFWFNKRWVLDRIPRSPCDSAIVRPAA